MDMFCYLYDIWLILQIKFSMLFTSFNVFFEVHLLLYNWNFFCRVTPPPKNYDFVLKNLSNYCNKINVIKENKTILKIKKKVTFLSQIIVKLK